MSEEVKDASRYVPIAIAWGYFGNGVLGLVVVVAFLFALPSLQDALNDSTGFPFIYAFENAVSTAGVNGLTATILIPVIFSNILYNASTGRQTYASARDKGLPFARWISGVDKKRKVPANAITVLYYQRSAVADQYRVGNRIQRDHLPQRGSPDVHLSCLNQLRDLPESFLSRDTSGPAVESGEAWTVDQRSWTVVRSFWVFLVILAQ